MSRENIDKIYQQNVLNIFKEMLGAKEDKQVAEIIGIIPEELANRKRRGTLNQVIFSEAIKRGLDLNALFQPEKKQGIKRQFLKEVEEWIDELCRKEKNRDVWFEYEFLDNFPMFKEWREGKEGKETEGKNPPISKVA